MKGIKLNNDMLLREKQRTIYRDTNLLFIYLSIEGFYGAVLSKEIKEQQSQITIEIDKKIQESKWHEYKDTTNDELISILFNIVSEWTKVKDAESPVGVFETVDDPVEGEKEILIGASEPSIDWYKMKDLLEEYPWLENLKLVENLNIELVTI